MDKENISYEHNLKHSVMCIKPVATIDESMFEVRMLSETSIPGTLPFTLVNDDSDCMKCQYDISGLETMEKHYAHTFISYVDIAKLINSIDQLLNELENYLLSENSVCLTPGTILMKPGDDNYIFTLVPGNTDLFTSSITKLLQYILTAIDSSHDRSLIMAYSLYQESTHEYFSMAELMRIVKLNIDKEEALKRLVTSSDESADDLKQHPEIASTGPLEDIMTGVKTHEIRFKPSDPEDQDDMNINQDISTFSKNRYEETPDTFSSSDYEVEDISFGPDDTGDKKKKSSAIAAKLNLSAVKRGLSGKLILSLSLMLLLPMIVYFLKGAVTFKRLMPIILILEVGIAVITALDYLMARLPEDD